MQHKDIPFKISIVNHSKEYSNGNSLTDKEKKVTLYCISVSSPIHNWKVKHRYNDFHNLNDLLQLSYSFLPKLPQKTFFSVSSESKIEKRKKDLEKYLKELLQIENIMGNVYVSQFFKTSQYFPDYLSRLPTVLCKYEVNKSLTFTDISYMPGRELNYALCSKGIRKPAGLLVKNKGDDLISPTIANEGIVHKSILNGFKFDEREPVNIFQDKKIVKTFDLKAHCLQYFPEAAIIVAGFSEGIIAVYKEDKKARIDEDFSLVNITKFKAMSDRITKIMINSAKGEMYAVGRKNKMKVIDMAFWNIKDTYTIGSTPILAIHLDEAYNLGLSTNPEGELLISDFSLEKPAVIKRLQICKEPLTLMECDVDSGKIILASGNTGSLYVVDIEFPFTCVVLISCRKVNTKLLHRLKALSSPPLLNTGKREERCTWDI